MKNASLAVFLLLAVVLVFWGMTGDRDDDEADFVFSQIAVCALAIASVVVAIRKSDLGIDLIASMGSKVVIVQCKRLSVEKEIPVRENVVAQL